jgi:hypothetical protein
VTFKLSKSPRGLVELLRLKTFGDAPGELLNAIQASIDARPFYSADILFANSATNSVGALAGVGIASVSNQAIDSLGVLTVGGTFTCGAAAGTNIVLSWGFFIRNTTLPVGSMFIGACLAGQQISFGTTCNPGFVLPGGSRLYAQATGNAAGADHTVQSICLIENLTSNN